MSKGIIDKLRPVLEQMQSTITKNMRAIRVHQFGGPEVLQYETNVSLPKLEQGTVLLRVRAAGINPVETYIRSGAYARKPTLPYTPGTDCAGVVEDVAGDVASVRKGDRVYSKVLSGSYAEYAVASACEVQPLSSELSFEQGAAIPIPYYTAYRALCIRGKASPGDTVLVHGASGGVGVAAVQIARSLGMRVLGTAGSSRGLEVVRQAGAHSVFDHSKEAYLQELKSEAEKLGGVDVIVENAAHFNLGHDLPLLAMGGRVAVVGSRGPVEVNARDTMSREADVRGVMLGNASEREARETRAAVRAGMEAGWLHPVVGKEFPLEEADRAHQEILSGRALGKMVLTVS